MTTDSSAHTVDKIDPFALRKLEEGQRTIHQLNEMALRGLPQMFDEKKQLFCFKLKKTPSGMIREELSPRYTMMTLMGFHRVEKNGGIPPLQIKPIMTNLLANTEWIDNIGDLGLLLWTCALIDPDQIASVSQRLDVKSALTRFSGAQRGRTMELSWFLAGLSHACLANPANLADFESPAVETYGRLVRNQGEAGFFGAYTRNRSLPGLVRGGIGSFADQVYPIYSFTRFAQAFGDSKAIERALDCALAICDEQGSQGQWWWHYNAASGRIINGFPVFSVHQHGMAPMALLALGEANNSDFSAWIFKGINWLSNNELSFEMRDPASQVIWRCIERSESHKYINAVMEAMTRRNHRESRHNLSVLFECRPYELGWLLYAFAGSDSQLSSIDLEKQTEVAAQRL
ncbi:MAG TPA: hypothetical protein VMU43_14390 [Candidatus Acidoferrum sp.]|nr:hypothetical protein [Candidatus Acidoferrum sp.]